MKLKLLFFYLVIPSALLSMDVQTHKEQPSLFFKIFVYMNELDLQKPGLNNKSIFGESIGYLLEHPLEHWRVPKTEIEKEIVIVWIKRLYAHKDDHFLQYMIEGLFAKIAKHDAFHACVVQLLQPEEKEAQKRTEIMMHLHFKRLKWLIHKQAHKKKSGSRWPCLVL